MIIIFKKNIWCILKFICKKIVKAKHSSEALMHYMKVRIYLNCVMSRHLSCTYLFKAICSQFIWNSLFTGKYFSWGESFVINIWKWVLWLGIEKFDNFFRCALFTVTHHLENKKTMFIVVCHLKIWKV